MISFNAQHRDQVNMGTLRNLVLPVDSIQERGEGGQLLSYDDRIVKDGVRGVHMEFQVALVGAGDVERRRRRAPPGPEFPVGPTTSR